MVSPYGVLLRSAPSSSLKLKRSLPSKTRLPKVSLPSFNVNSLNSITGTGLMVVISSQAINSITAARMVMVISFMMIESHIQKITAKLLFSQENLDRNSRKIKAFPELVFKVSFIRFPDVLREVTKKSKRRRICRQLGNIFDLYIFSFKTRRGMISDCFKHDFIQARCRNFFSSVLTNLYGSFKHFKDALFCAC